MVIHRLWKALVVAGSICALSGCYEDNCELRGTCPLLVVDAEDSLSVTCDEASEVPRDGCGVFVSAVTGDDANGNGSRYAPFRTIQKALTVSEKGHHTVYACAEVFDEHVTLTTGYRIIGGLACDGDYLRSPHGERTIVRGGPGAPALRVTASGRGVARAVDVRFEAADAVTPSGSSIAAVLADGAIASFERCQFFAGRGMSGEDGASAIEDGAVAAAGPSGLSGANACSAETPAGGSFVQAQCDDGIVTSGGLGGPGGFDFGFDGTEGTPAPALNPEGFGLSGVGETEATACAAGADGADGEDGAHGLGAHSFGWVEKGGYVGLRGSDGAHGGPGQGGGGGGGSRGGPLLCGDKPKGGAGGGSGGAGGCGGRGGGGGGYGGASIGIVVGDAILLTAACEVGAGDAGHGGTGGMYQLGGFGGQKGLGGHASGGSSTGCAGGVGGRGGRGGYGGGGSGGPSVGVAHGYGLGVQDITLVTLGKPGQGGSGGNPNVLDLKGSDGAAAPILWMPPYL